MSNLTIGIFGSSRKENERRLPIHPAHLDRIDAPLREKLFLETGYGAAFGSRDADLADVVRGVLTQDELIDRCDVVLLPKPLPEDLARLREGQVLWGWPHCVQDEELTQVAIDRKLTLIAWEAMNHWTVEGAFNLHVFHKNNEMAGYCSVMHALQLVGRTGEYGRKISAAVISFGATGRGAVSALQAMGIQDITIMTGRPPTAVEAPLHNATMYQFGPAEDGSERLVVSGDREAEPMAQVLARRDVIVNCVLQDPDDPYIFINDDELRTLPPGTLIVDVSCDKGMGFEWARPTSFEDPMLTVGDRVHYYAVDHSPSYLWDSATWEISDALLPFLPIVMSGPEAWDADPVINRAIEIRDGVIQNPKILSFQARSETYPHDKA